MQISLRSLNFYRIISHMFLQHFPINFTTRVCIAAHGGVLST